MHKIILLILALNCASFSAQDSLIIENLRANMHTIQCADGKITGPGAEILEDAVRRHQLIMVGEMHGIREVGDFCEALFNTGKKHGFHYFAIESDPWVAEKIETLAQYPVDSLEAFEKAIPFSIPFYGNKSDFPFLQTIVQQEESPGKKIWGLDQTFVAATRFLFQEIKQKAKSQAGKQLAQSHFDKAVEAFQEAMGSGNPSGVYLLKLSEADFKELETTFRQEENFEALEIVNGIKKSRQIYQHWYDGENYLNNRVRSQWMKNTFMRYYNEAMFRDGSLPKVMFKFGSNHAMRGLTPVHVYDLGNMISELAESKGNESLHIKFTALKGTTYNMLMGPQEFDSTEDYDSRVMEAIGEKANGKEWIMIDLRPLRNIRLKNESASFKSTVFGFDYWVIAPAGTPLEPFQ